MAVFEMTYGILPVSFSFVGLVNKADCRSESALRFLNLKRFPRTRAQVGEGWKRPRCKLHRLVTTTPVPRALTPLAPGFIVELVCTCGYVCLFRINCCAGCRMLRHNSFLVLRGARCEWPRNLILAIFCRVAIFSLLFVCST